MASVLARILVNVVDFLIHSDDEIVELDSAVKLLEYIGWKLDGSPDSLEAMRAAAEEAARDAEVEGDSDAAERLRMLIDELMGVDSEEGE